jgi:hypothetical protein
MSAQRTHKTIASSASVPNAEEVAKECNASNTVSRTIKGLTKLLPISTIVLTLCIASSRAGDNYTDAQKMAFIAEAAQAKLRLENVRCLGTEQGLTGTTYYKFALV